MVDRSGQNIGHYWRTGFISLVVTVLVGGCGIVQPEKNIPASLVSRATPTTFSDATAVITTNPTWLTSLTPTNTSSPTQVNIPAVELPEEIIDSKGVVMRLVSAGSFMMGSDSLISYENPVHSVTLDDYYMDIYEVTNALYATCADTGGCKPPHYTGSHSQSNYYRNSIYLNYPVIYVDWSQAKNYCEWRGARLPSEAEWEKAARGTDGRTYPWGNGINCTYANYGGCTGDITEVGNYESGISPHGMYDMAGNVWEWVNDWYDADYYQDSPAESPQGPLSGTF